MAKDSDGYRPLGSRARQHAAPSTRVGKAGRLARGLGGAIGLIASLLSDDDPCRCRGECRCFSGGLSDIDAAYERHERSDRYHER